MMNFIHANSGPAIGAVIGTLIGWWSGYRTGRRHEREDQLIRRASESLARRSDVLAECRHMPQIRRGGKDTP